MLPRGSTLSSPRRRGLGRSGRKVMIVLVSPLLAPVLSIPNGSEVFVLVVEPLNLRAYWSVSARLGVFLFGRVVVRSRSSCASVYHSSEHALAGEFSSCLFRFVS